MIVVDTSIWIDLLRDPKKAPRFRKVVADQPVFLTRFHQLELLQGARDEREWNLLTGYLATQDYLEAGVSTWEAAAKIYFDLRRRGKTVRSPIDCCIAELVLDSRGLLLHRDRDFEVIAEIRPLRHLFLDW